MGDSNPSSTVPELPVELWEGILQTFIDDLHLFLLNPYQFEMRINGKTTAPLLEDWHDRNPERVLRNQRALLRSVCRTWKEFADSERIKHRFVDIWDLVMGNGVTIEHVLRAQRLGGPNPYTIMPRNSKKPYFPSGKIDVVGLTQQVPKALIAAAEANHQFKAEIASTIGPRMSGFILEEHPEAFPHLKSLQIDLSYWFWPGPPLCILGKISTGFKNMVYLELHMGTNFAFMSTDILDLPRLESLIIFARHGISNAPFTKWRLPALYDLKLDRLKNLGEMKQFLNGLANFGGNLRSLSVGFFLEDGEEYSCMSSIWTSCPKLRKLGLPFTPALSAPPPPDHPLDVLLNAETNRLFPLFRSSTIPFHEAMSRFCSSTSNLKIIQDCHRWNADLGGASVEEFRNEGWRQEAARALSDGRVRFEDSNGYCIDEPRWLCFWPIGPPPPSPAPKQLGVRMSGEHWG
ncbi:hypothetical protein FRC17_009840 [Serendipita sp. 399]|nr:hypothetical protein FRC17_009840 [Serendipita sp. 399]